MSIDNNRLTDLMVKQSHEVWRDFLELFNSDYALLFFGIGGVVMGVVAQYNSKLSSIINKVILLFYKIGKTLSIVVAIIGCLIIAAYAITDKNQSIPLVNALQQKSLLVYAFIVCVAALAIGLFVVVLNQPYPDLKNNVAGLGVLLGVIYFLFEVQGIESAPLIIVGLLFFITVIYLWGDPYTDKKEYLANELKKSRHKQAAIQKHLQKLERKEREDARKNNKRR